LYQSHEADQGTAGFTLIEALVALSIVAIVLSSIGAVVANAVKGTRSLEGRVNRLATAKSLLLSLPERNSLVPGSMTGTLDGNPWRIDVSPLANSKDSKLEWVPQRVILTVRNSLAGDMVIETVRLGRKDAR
jgi:general secretion pathway protein I